MSFAIISIITASLARFAEFLVTVKALKMGMRETWGIGAIKKLNLPDFISKFVEFLSDNTVGRLGSKPKPWILAITSSIPILVLLLINYYVEELTVYIGSVYTVVFSYFAVINYQKIKKVKKKSK